MSYYQSQTTKSRTALWVGLAVVLLAMGAFFLDACNTLWVSGWVGGRGGC
jgi:hypothetical protein